MKRGINDVSIGGSVGQAPEIKEIGNSKLATFSVAVNEEYKKKDGEKVQNTHWFNVEAWGPLANLVESYVQKGTNLYVAGSLAQDRYEDKDGNKRVAVKIRAEKVLFLGGGANSQSESPVAQASQGAQQYTADNTAQPAQPAQPVSTVEDQAWSQETDDLPF